MKPTVLKMLASAVLLTSAAPAFADLIYQTGTQQSGTGLGAVSTVVTVQDNGNGQQDGIQSGCVTYTAGGDPASPATTCQMGLLGGDNTSGNAGNNTYLLSDIAGLTSAGQLGFIVDINEGAPTGDATLTDIYLSLFNTLSNTLMTYAYTGPDLVLSGTGGNGQSGIHRFVLDGLQASAASAFCPDLSQCVVGGGIQFAQGSTQAAPETVYIGAFTRTPGGPGGGEIPEPGSFALLGIGALAFNALRRRNGRK